MIRLLIADDHAIVRTGLKQIFAQVSDLEVVAEAESGPEVMQRLRTADIDLLLLDLNMPGINGVDLIARVKAQQPDLPVLVLSMHDEPNLAARVLKAGASGYITKDCDLDILLPAIRKVAAGGQYISPGMAEKMVFYVNTTTHSASHRLLTEREMAVLQWLIAGKSVNEIAAHMVISAKTVSTHKVRLMEKMALSSMADLMRYAMQHGLLH